MQFPKPLPSPTPTEPPVAGDRAWSWTYAVVAIGVPLWAFVLLAEILGMEAWRFASAGLEIAEPAVRTLQYLVLLPFLLVACRAAVAIGWRGTHAALRVFAQVALCAGFSALSRPALAVGAALSGRGDLAAPLVDSLLNPDAEMVAVWVAASSATAMHYLLCLGAIVGIKTYRDLEGERVLRAEIQRQMAQARLQALKNQLNPHFLFNALNTVVALIESEPRLAQTLVTRISDLLRRILSDGAAPAVTLRHELETLERYLAIQELRFPSRLTHEFVVADDAARTLVPALIVQPLLENAVLHGLAGNDGPVHVRLEARLEGSRLEIAITNPGPAIAPAGGTGVGLRNVADRLQTLFGERATVRLESPAPGRYRATLSIPQVALAPPAAVESAA